MLDLKHIKLPKSDVSFDIYQVKDIHSDTVLNTAIEEDLIEPFGLFHWDSSFTACSVLDDLFIKKEFEDVTDIIDLGCGSGISSLAALSLNAQCKVLALDLNPQALELLNYAALQQNIQNRLTTQIYDITNKSNQLPHCNLLIISDLLYYPSLAKKCGSIAANLVSYSECNILITDPGRSTQNDFLTALKYQLELNLQNTTTTNNNNKRIQYILNNKLEFHEHTHSISISSSSDNNSKGYYIYL